MSVGTTQDAGSTQLGNAAAERVRAGREITAREEMSALDFLLGETIALEYDVTVQLETPGGLRPLTVHFRQLDPSRFDAHDTANRKGDGPFAKLDVAAFSAAVCAEAIVYLEEGERRVNLRDGDFRGGHPGGAQHALSTRFRFQGGLLEGIAEEVKRVSGYGPDRVGTAQRSLVEVGKGS